jgi:hypothetical protein
MTIKSRKEYLQAVQLRYHNANKQEKTPILNEFCINCGYHRKYAIRLLKGKKKKKKSQIKSGPKPVYQNKELLVSLKRIWFATDQMCSKKLQAAIPLFLPFYEQEYGFMDDHSKAKLHTMSPSTIDRLLKPVRTCYTNKGRCGTRPGTLLKNQIPIQTGSWDISQPGFLEADSVAHCGNSLAGNFVWSLTFTDIASTWTENRAVWNKGAHGVITQTKDVEENLPFSILGFDCDNGSEFLNHHLHRYFTNRPANPVKFTRSRPYKKNDNAHVEQKNWSHVRQLLGYDRFDKPQLVDLLNDLYKNECSLYNNYFCPSMKLTSKKRINSKYVKKYDTPKTPYQRLIASVHVSLEAKQKLTDTFQLLNPFILKKKIESKLKIISAALQRSY